MEMCFKILLHKRLQNLFTLDRNHAGYPDFFFLVHSSCQAANKKETMLESQGNVE